MYKALSMIQIIELTQQRDQLLAALKVIVEAGGIGPDDMFDDARDAITRAERPL